MLIKLVNFFDYLLCNEYYKWTLPSKCVETSNFPVYSREEQFYLSKGKRIRMVEKNSNNEKFLLYILVGIYATFIYGTFMLFPF